MKLWAPRSLSQKLVALVLATTLIAAAMAVGVITTYDLRAYHRSLLADMSTQAELLARTSVAALTFDDARVAEENLSSLHLRPQIGAAAIYTARGQEFAKYLRAGDRRGVPALPEPDGTRVDAAELLVFKRIAHDGELLGTVFLRADYDLRARVVAYLGLAAAVLVCALLAAYLATQPLRRMLTDPVLAIARIAREVVERRDYSRRAELLGNDEVGTLVVSFNGMLIEIERRTSELEVANDELERQVAERIRAEGEILRLNEQLEARVGVRTAQLQAANQELEAFCYSVSHDLRAPLRAIDGFSQALVEDFAASVPEGGRRYLSRIQSAAKRMGQLIEDLLSLSRMSRGALDRHAVDLGDLAQEVANELQQRDPQRLVEVSIWEGMKVAADPCLLRVVLENLIANAWKFTAHAARPQIEVGALRDGAKATYFVRDNGAGFDMAYSDKLFGAFQRLHAESEFPGTGIGLATVQRIINRHGGRVWADGRVGQGAIFFFTLAPHDGRAEAPWPTAVGAVSA